MPRLSPDQRQQAIGRLNAGQSVQQVARAFGVNVTTVYRLQQRFHATNSTCDLPGRGRPGVTTARQDRHLVHQYQRDAFETAANTARNTFGVHRQPVSAITVRRRLGGQNLLNRRPPRRPVLTAQHRLDRLAWAQQHTHWRHRDWRRVLFLDEKRFCLEPGDGRVRIWRRPGQRFANNNILQHDRWGGASVMKWGAIGVNQRVGPVVFQNVGQGRRNGVNADRYINQILRPYVVQFVQRHRNCLFQQDNARPHTARATQDFLRHNSNNLLPHPARSPDLNPIEHFWDIMQRRINALARRPRTAAELRAAVTQLWAQVPQQPNNHLVLSMYRRCATVINAQGGTTRY
ncbi:hypothetical protein V1264_016894 [Littorina saxatilis]|uniref:Transposase n=1 Tax=Littorina saxatilis TaxID=31220 RepID=A0AAN9GE06_9CAEN